MNKIEKLINELCPNGVEFKELGELGYFYWGLKWKSKSDFSNWNAKFITYMNVFSNIEVNTDIKDFVKIDEWENQTQVEYWDILFTGSSETPDECWMSSVLTKKINEPIYLNSFCFGFRLNDKSLFLPDFLKYLFRDLKIRKKISKTASWVTRFNISKKRFSKIKIPLPPLDIQKEIVKILDNFTKLEAELEAELEARMKQYEYYRDKLLSFEDGEVEWKELGEVCEIANNLRQPIRADLRVSWNIPYYWANNIQDYVDWFTHEWEYILIAEDGSASLDKYSIQYAQWKFWANNHVHVLRWLNNLNKLIQKKNKNNL